MKKSNLKRMMHAFTLVELLVVISIIGILAALLLANFAGIRDRADDARIKNNMKQLQTAVRMFYNDNGNKYPDLSNVSCGSISEGSLTIGTYITTSDLPSVCKFDQLSADSFVACGQLANDKDGEILESQTRCGMGTITGVANAYCVCTK